MAAQSFSISLAICAVATVGYQYIIALLMGYVVIPGMDAATFVSSSKTNANCLNISYYDQPPNPSVVEFSLRKLMNTVPKMTYKIVEFGGEYYYQPLHKD